MSVSNPDPNLTPVSPEKPPEAKPKKASGNPITRLRTYAVDSYNGLYKIVLEPSMPTRQTIFILLFGLLVGMGWAYMIRPVEYYNGSPNELAQSARDQWVKLVAAGKEAGMYDDQGIINLLQNVENPSGTVQRLEQQSPDNSVEKVALQRIAQLASQAGSGTPAPEPNLTQSIIAFIIPILVLTIVTPILVVVWRLLIQPNIFAPIWEAIRPKSEEDKERAKRMSAERKALEAQRTALESMKQTVDESLGAPTMQKVSIYTKGRAYDESFEIENAQDVFLGECGVSIASKNEGGEPTAIEVWLFDMASQDTISKFVVAEGSANDPALRSKLEPRVQNPATDIVVASNGAIVIIDSQGVQLQATIATADYNADKTYFEGLQTQIAAWQKSGQSSPAPAPVAPVGNFQLDPAPAIPSMPSPPPASFPSMPSPPPASFPNVPASPPAMPSANPPAPSPPAGWTPQPPSPPPSGSGLGGFPPPSPRPLAPPPLKQPADEEDDPFGGTGDFTPLR